MIRFNPLQETTPSRLGELDVFVSAQKPHKGDEEKEKPEECVLNNNRVKTQETELNKMKMRFT